MFKNYLKIAARNLLKHKAYAFINTAGLAVGMACCLQDFAYHTKINSFIFVLAGLFALVIAWLTVGYQALKAALANPVDSLRYEQRR